MEQLLNYLFIILFEAPDSKGTVIIGIQHFKKIDISSVKTVHLNILHNIHYNTDMDRYSAENVKATNIAIKENIARQFLNSEIKSGNLEELKMIINIIKNSKPGQFQVCYGDVDMGIVERLLIEHLEEN